MLISRPIHTHTRVVFIRPWIQMTHMDPCVSKKLDSQRPYHSIYCALAWVLERAQVSKFRFVPWFCSGKQPFHAIPTAAKPATLASRQLPPEPIQGRHYSDQAYTAPQPPTTATPIPPHRKGLCPSPQLPHRPLEKLLLQAQEGPH